MRYQRLQDNMWRDLSGATFYTECAVSASQGTLNDAGAKPALFSAKRRSKS